MPAGVRFGPLRSTGRTSPLSRAAVQYWSCADTCYIAKGGRAPGRANRTAMIEDHWPVSDLLRRLSGRHLLPT